MSNKFTVKNGLVIKDISDPFALTIGNPATTGYQFPATTGTVGQALVVDSNGDLTFGTVAGAPGGANTQIQYNDNGAFEGDTGFTTNGAGSVVITGDLSIDNINIDGNTISSTDTDGDIILLPDGNGLVVAQLGYDMSAGPAYAFATKDYVDSTIGSGVFSGALVYRTSTQSIPNSVDTIVTWNGVAYDTNNDYYSAGNPTRLTIPANVTRVKVSAGVTFQPSTNHHRLVILKNGVVTWIGSPGNQDFTSTSGAQEVTLSAQTPVIDVQENDYFEVQVYQSGGAAQNILADVSWFGVQVVTTTIITGPATGVTSVNTGDGLTGGPITTTGTINLDFAMSTITPASTDRLLIWDDSTSTVANVLFSDFAGTPGGADTQIQYNDNGSFQGDTGFTTDGNGSVVITGDLSVDNINIDGNTISSTDTNGNIILAPNGTGWINASSSRITNVEDPINAQDAATKAYVDSVSAGLDPKESVRVATTDILATETGKAWTPAGSGVGKTLTANTNGTTTIDGILLALDNRILVKNESTGLGAIHNGIYVVTQVGDGSNPTILTRATDQDGTPTHEVSGGNFTFVETGTVNGATGWVVVADGIIDVDSDPITWTQFTGIANVSILNVGSGAEVFRDQTGTDYNFRTLNSPNTYIDVAEVGNEIHFTFDPNEVDLNSLGDVNFTTGPAVDGYALTWDNTAGEFVLTDVSVTPVTPGGANTQIQYNDNGAFEGDTGFTTDGAGSVVITGDLSVDNININGNILSSTDTDGNIELTPNGTGNVLLSGLEYPNTDGTAGQALVTNGSGVLSFATVAGAPGGANTQIQYNNSGVFGGDTGFTTNGSGSVVITGDLSVDNINIDGNTISSTNTDGNVVINPDGNGWFEVEGIQYSKRQTQTINDNQTTAATIFTYAAADWEGVFVDYTVVRDTNVRTGTIHIAAAGTTIAAMADTGAEAGDIGVSFDVDNTAGTVTVSYTSTNTGNSGTMAYSIRRWNV